MKLFNENGVEVISLKAFQVQYHPQVSVQGLMAAAKIHKLDFIQPERDLFIVLTDKTLNYVPRTFKGKR